MKHVFFCFLILVIFAPMLQATEDIALLEERVAAIMQETNVSVRGREDAVFQLAEHYEAEGELLRAIELYEYGLKINSWRYAYQVRLIALYHERGDMNAAIEKALSVYEFSDDEWAIEQAQAYLDVYYTGPDPKSAAQFFDSAEIVLVPVGNPDMRILELVRAELEELVGVRYLISETVVPIHTFERKFAKQFNADTLLRAVANRWDAGDDGGVYRGFLGVSDQDMFANDFNFLFGWARPGYGVLSYHRFRKWWNHFFVEDSAFIDRIVKQGVSSSFFILGIKRCSTPSCVRAYPNTLTEHERKTRDICAVCRKRLYERLHKEKNVYTKPKGAV